MKKVLKFFVITLMLFTMVGCGTAVKKDKYTLKDFEGKTFNGRLGGQMSIVFNKEPFKHVGKETVYFGEKTDYISFNSKKEVILDDGTPARIPFVYYNPRIVEDNGKYYLMADRLPERFEIIDKDNLMTNSDKNPFFSWK